MKLLLLLLTLSVYFPSPAQNQIPAFGKIDKADLQLTDCSFDKGAEALVLIDWGNTYYDRGTSGISLFKTIFERRIRIKILKEKGMSQADVRIRYYSHNNDQKILRIAANTYNIDAAGEVQTSEVKKNAIYSKRISADFSDLIISFPDVKVGSVIEYKYTMERETIELRDWFFQGRIPVQYSQYQLTIPQIFRFSVQPSIIDPVEDKQEVITERISLEEGFVETKSLKSSYIMRNLPGIKDEPFMSSPKDYMQRLEFQLSQIDYGNGSIRDLRVKWSDAVKDLTNSPGFGLQLEKTVSGAEPSVAQAKQLSNMEKRMEFLFNTVRKNITCNNNEDIFTDNGIIKTWDTKAGNNADINLLLVKLLRDAGLKASPILFSTRDNGLVNTTFPFLSQFNTVMAAVTIDDNFFVLDASDKLCHYKLVPQKITNSEGFIVEGENGRWKSIFSGKHKYKVMAAVHGEIDAKGVIKGDALVNCFDYARRQRCEKWQSDKPAFKTAYFNTAGTSYTIDDFTINNLDTDSLPLEQKVKFSGLLNGSGDYRYFTVNLFADLDKNPFAAEERVSDIDFGFLQDYTIYGNYTVPEDYSFDGLPENLYMIMPDTSIVFTRTIQAEENLLNVRISVEFKRPYYAAAVYPEFASFYKKMFAKLNEQVVIKKKAQP